MEQAHQGDGIFEIETDDLVFRKTLEGSDGTIAEVSYRIRSLSDEPIACRIRNRVPEGLSESDVYVRPGNDEWTVTEDGTIAFEGRLLPGTETSVTVSLNTENEPHVDPLGPEPSIDIARPQDANTESSERIEMASEEWNESDSGSEPPATVPIEIPDDIFDDVEVPPPNDIETLGSGDEGGDGIELSFEGRPNNESGRESRDHVPEAKSQSGGGGAAPERSTIAGLLDELEQEPESSESIDRLREILGIDRRPPGEDRGTLKAKVEHLRREVADLVVYREALAEFIDEQGTGTEVVQRLEDSLDEHDSRLSTLDGAVDATTDDLVSVREAVETAEADIVRIEERLESVETVRPDVDRLKSELRETSSRFDDEFKALATELASVGRQLERTTSMLEDDVVSIQEEVTAARQWRKSLGQALSSHDAIGDEM